MFNTLKSVLKVLNPQLKTFTYLRRQGNNDFSCSTAQGTVIQLLLNKIEELRQRELNRSEFLSYMSHELRTPLNNIINFNRFVIQRNSGHINNDQENALLQSIHSAEQLLALINNVLDLTKIEANMMRLFIEDNINIQKQLHDIALTATISLADKPIELRTTISSDIQYIVGDRRRIHQIILNLVSNACKFTQEGRIEISGKIQGEDLIILISDTGPGILETDLNRIFEPFEQTQIGLTSTSGTGLGLSITKSLVEAHGGKMIVQSQRGVGSTFGFRMPTRSQILLYRMKEDMRKEAV